MSPWPVSLAVGLALTLLSGGVASACNVVYPCAPVYGQGPVSFDPGAPALVPYGSSGYSAAGYAPGAFPPFSDVQTAWGQNPAYGPYPPAQVYPQVYGPPGFAPPINMTPVHGPVASGPCCAPCFNPCQGAEGLTLPGSFFSGAGGVGPIPSDGYGGGGYYVVGAGGSGEAFSGATAYAQAYASAVASARISIHGGYSVGHGGYGGHWGGHGGRGPGGHGHGGKGGKGH